MQLLCEWDVSSSAALVAGCLGFGLRWAAGADAGGGGVRPKSGLALEGSLRPARTFLGLAEVEECWSSFEG